MVDRGLTGAARNPAHPGQGNARQMKGFGKHILVEFYGCEFALLNDPKRLRELALEAVAQSGATIMSDLFLTFEPHGVTGVVVIAESHMSLHTWPEHGYMALDYFTCGERVEIQAAVDVLARGLDPETVESTLRPRGLRLAGRPHHPRALASGTAQSAAPASTNAAGNARPRLTAGTTADAGESED